MTISAKTTTSNTPVCLKLPADNIIWHPLTAVILGALLLGEPLTLAMCLGGVLILAGIFLCNKPLARVREKGI